jgi:enolase
LVILDSRGSETVEVTLQSGNTSVSVGAPSGKSRGAKEVAPFPENDARKSVQVFYTVLKQKLLGFDASDQKGVDELLKRVDGTPNFSRVGGNLAYAVSAASALLAARAQNIPPWEHIAKLSGLKPCYPLPLGNVLGGGAHAGMGAPDIQEFLVFPQRVANVVEAVKKNVETHKRLGGILLKKVGGYGGGRGDEGAYAPPLNDEAALEAVKEAAAETGMGLGLDVAASNLYSAELGKYFYKNRGVEKTVEEQLEYIAGLVERFGLTYVEDPFHEEDFESHKRLCRMFPKLLVCGDDLVVTRAELIREAARKGSVRAVILKPNQVGTLSDTVAAAVEAERNRIVRVVSHRSGETCDGFLTHLAVGLGATFIKAGVFGGERVAKANELVRIYSVHGESLPLAEVGVV